MKTRAVSLPLALIVAHSVSAQTWTETGDAGHNPHMEQVVSGVGPLTQIDGSLPTGFDVDVYRIRIADHTMFRATTTAGTAIDTQLWLFHLDGTGVTFNDDDPGGGLQSRITDPFVTANGDYLLAISRFDRDPIDASDGQLWADNPFNTERRCDSVAGSISR